VIVVEKILIASSIGKTYKLPNTGSKNREGSKISPVDTESRRILGSHQLDPDKERFWALKDISFELSSGERLGIIGPNGSGKSTLLKILSRIIAPSAGSLKYHGKLLSILEVGSGFHPELSGLDNIFLNARLNGYQEQAVKRLVPEIIEFSGLGQQIESNISTYSSGMFARLAFSVASHLPSEILLIDEVLAVGDADFQARCKSKMLQLQNEDRALIFVSHDMDAVETVCDSVLTINQGVLASYDGEERMSTIKRNPSEAVARYLGHSINQLILEIDKGGGQYVGPWFHTGIRAVELVTRPGERTFFRVHHDATYPKSAGLDAIKISGFSASGNAFFNGIWQVTREKETTRKSFDLHLPQGLEFSGYCRFEVTLENNMKSMLLKDEITHSFSPKGNSHIQLLVHHIGTAGL
jgi:ABC-type polysaccharide/polyol phosphate transport system ATPase subunit